MKKIYKVIIVLEMILLSFFIIGYIVYEINHFKKDNQTCSSTEGIVILDVAEIKEINTTNIENKELTIWVDKRKI